jgi:hypothetical protein
MSTVRAETEAVMEAIAEHNGAAVFPAIEALPVEKEEWPDDAGRAYNDLLRGLNSWCREHDCSMVTNSWIAEEAVRQSW